MKWRKRGKKTSSAAASGDPMALVDAGVKDPDDLTPDQMALLDRELNEELPPEAARGLERFFEPPADFRATLGRGIEKKLLGRETAMMCFDLFSTGWHTTRVVMSPEEKE